MNSHLWKVLRGGDYRESLVALRDRLAEDLDGTDDPRDAATLSKELREVLKAIDALPVAGGVSKLEDLRRQRADRQAG